MKTVRAVLPAVFVPILAVLSASCAGGRGAADRDGFMALVRRPDAVAVVTEDRTVELVRDGRAWRAQGLEVGAEVRAGRLLIELSAPGVAVKSIKVRWNVRTPDGGWKYLGDAWERSYGDLEWQPLDPGREMPWYFLASDGRTTHGYGVMTGPAAMCAWQTGTDEVALTADVRCGGAGVRLGGRRLTVCGVTSRRGRAGETPFQAARAFCRQMCPAPRLPRRPVYGFNDWYCDYGRNNAASVLYYAAWIARLSPDRDNRPFMVVDDGWQAGGGSGYGGPWDRGNSNFPSMPDLAAGIRGAGARPGIWIHLLTAQASHPEAWRLPHDPRILDISVPEVRRYVMETVARLRAWGYELIKHDYSVSDLAGYTRAAPAADAAWAYADRGRTAAEIVLDHYRSIREAAGDDAVLIGCNTIGHLAAGVFELQRTGDDTSGRDWARVRNRGVNTLAFRAPQHEAFFAVDADCVGLTEAEAIPWACNAQWLDLVARSGTPLFVSFKKDALTPEQETVVAAALAMAARPQPLAEPLDWFEAVNPTRGLEAISHLEGGAAPRHWKLMGRTVEYDWWSCPPSR